jgi:GNAT superfamily N-acetyltransferase
MMAIRQYDAGRVPSERCGVTTTTHGWCSVATATAADLEELLALMRAYCDFYSTSPGDGELLALSRTLLADPEHEGVQLIARDERATAVGFASVFWSWDTTEASRVGIMNDLFVVAEARGRGAAEALIGASCEHCAERGARRLDWQTAPENARARAVYERVGGVRESWLSYSLAVPPR